MFVVAVALVVAVVVGEERIESPWEKMDQS